MTKHEMAYTDTSMLGPAALLLNQFFNSPIPEHWLLWVVFVSCDTSALVTAVTVVFTFTYFSFYLKIL